MKKVKVIITKEIPISSFMVESLWDYWGNLQEWTPEQMAEQLMGDYVNEYTDAVDWLDGATWSVEVIEGDSQ